MDLSDFLHEGRGQYYKKTDEARFSKKKFNLRLEGINCQKMIFFTLLQNGSNDFDHFLHVSRDR